MAFRQTMTRFLKVAWSSTAISASLLTSIPSLALFAPIGLIASSPAQAAEPGHESIVSFEDAPAGSFKSLDTALGKWSTESGAATVDARHAKSGDQCLHITGGDKSSVVLELSKPVAPESELSFWAERWTKRAPFSFRIEQDLGDGWREIYNGDGAIRVGRAFLSEVHIPLQDRGIKRLRFSVTSPAETGVLIDDVSIGLPQPQKIVAIEQVPFVLPALVGTRRSALAKVRVETQGRLRPISLSELQATLTGTTSLDNMFGIELLHSVGANSQLANSKQLVTVDSPKSTSQVVELKLSPDAPPLAEGVNYFWIACSLHPDANVDHRVGADCTELRFSNGQTVDLKPITSAQRIGVAVRQGGDDGAHTYRIPGLATTNRGTLIGVYDVRRRGGGDLPGDIDVGMSRSTDGGRTWQPMQIIMDMGSDPAWRYDGIGDPAVLVDRETGTIWVAATWSHGNRSWHGSGPGLKPEETGQLMLVRSDDEGQTWSQPINITAQVKRPEWCFLLQGPGKGITMRDGTLVFAAQYQDPPSGNRLPHSTIIYSKDHGKTWRAGNGAYDDTTEAQVVEVEPGVLMLNCRYNRKAARVVMTTKDLGQTWQKHSTSERALIEPGACMASLIDIGREGEKLSVDNWLLFSNPDSVRGRHHLTIKASPDRGETWPKQHRLLLDEGISGGYSCMALIDSRTVGILYEGSQAHMTFLRIPLSELTKNREQRPKTSGPAVPKGQGETTTPETANRPPQADPNALHLPRIFGHHMVLQADAPIPVWGRAKPGQTVEITLGDKSMSAVANAHGEWQLRLAARPANATPDTLRVRAGSDSMEFHDVLIGEVWVCAGQSNMEWPLAKSDDGAAELRNADHPAIRLYHCTPAARGGGGAWTPQQLRRMTPEAFFEANWQAASADAAGQFSAVAWHFGRTLHRDLKVPIGLISLAVGGSPAEAWIPAESLDGNDSLRELIEGNWLDNPRLGDFCRTRGEENLLPAIQSGDDVLSDTMGPNHPFKPGFLWSAGVEPLIPFGIRGAIWYQGESNAESVARVRDHSQLFPLLVTQWRQRWGQGDFPFLYVQLPALNRPEWPAFREGQRRLLSELEQLGMAITIDTGHPTNVHPTGKRPVGERLARWALGTTYANADRPRVYSGPLFRRAERKGNAIEVTFDHAGAGLKAADGAALCHFEVCGTDGVFRAATARIVATNIVAVSSEGVTAPRDVRYAWQPYPVPAVNLVNDAGLPASPFTSAGDFTIESKP
ncbi:MAG: exo-alpha-sialidase [Planctomycetales bacterium]|nr:exo-alpha-sialidase [Planctomycetales bacterium]